MTKKSTATADYEVVTARVINGLRRAKGDIIALTSAQAKYYMPPYGSGLKPVGAKSSAKPKAEKPDT